MRGPALCAVIAGMTILITVAICGRVRELPPIPLPIPIVPPPLWLCGQGHHHREEAMAEECDQLAARRRAAAFFEQVDRWREETWW